MDDGEYIEISKRDIRKEEECLSCIDLGRNIWVRFGFPMNAETGIVGVTEMRNLSGPPYVFTAARIVLTDDKHPEGVEFNNIKVIFMHGGREDGGKWMFSSLKDGYPVVETVIAVNRELLSQGESPVKIVMACNNEISNPEIKIGDFPGESDLVYAVGETVSLRRAGMDKEGSIYFEAKAKDFWGLEDLEVFESIKILD